MIWSGVSRATWPESRCTSAARRAASSTTMSVLGRYFGFTSCSRCEYEKGMVVPFQSFGTKSSRFRFAFTAQLMLVAWLPNLSARAWNVGSVWA